MRRCCRRSRRTWHSTSCCPAHSWSMLARSTRKGWLPVARGSALTWWDPPAATIAGRLASRRRSTAATAPLIGWPSESSVPRGGPAPTGPRPKTTAQDHRPRVPRAVITVAFAAADCRRCPSHARCTTQARRSLTLHPQAHEAALRAARQREQTQAFALAYAQRAGVESAHAQALRRCDLRRSRYVGLSKTHLQHVLTAVALNLVRVWAPGSLALPWRLPASRPSRGS